ncbi:unnamed protein product [Linum trigynum]|uniref:Uncharacterized protein n=1 Tax=Linum trigynum TaxID=586398 RepID=A0AAV2DD34_9ROSI
MSSSWLSDPVWTRIIRTLDAICPEQAETVRAKGWQVAAAADDPTGLLAARPQQKTAGELPREALPREGPPSEEDEDDGVDNIDEPRQSWEQDELTDDGKIEGGDLVTPTAAIPSSITSVLIPAVVEEGEPDAELQDQQQLLPTSTTTLDHFSSTPSTQSTLIVASKIEISSIGREGSCDKETQLLEERSQVYSIGPKSLSGSSIVKTRRVNWKFRGKILGDGGAVEKQKGPEEYVAEARFTATPTAVAKYDGLENKLKEKGKRRVTEEKKSRANPAILLAAASQGNPFVAAADWEMVEEPPPRPSPEERRATCRLVRCALPEEEETEGDDVSRSRTVRGSSREIRSPSAKGEEAPLSSAVPCATPLMTNPTTAAPGVLFSEVSEDIGERGRSSSAAVVPSSEVGQENPLPESRITSPTGRTKGGRLQVASAAAMRKRKTKEGVDGGGFLSFTRSRSAAVWAPHSKS